ncbi:hypothetical protein TNCV_3959311 [Trichonephila clavipes]|nr:hypothetical protein TNCV_3959311 [Trichonephila clavipes]
MDAYKCIVPLRHRDTLNKIVTSPLGKLVEVEDGRLLPPSRVFSLKLEEEPILIVQSPAWCSKIRLTTGVHLNLSLYELCESRSDTVSQAA